MRSLSSCECQMGSVERSTGFMLNDRAAGYVECCVGGLFVMLGRDSANQQRGLREVQGEVGVEKKEE